MSLQVIFDLDKGFLAAWWFDPLFATICFGVFINYYWYHERIRGLSTCRTFSESVWDWQSCHLLESFLAYWVGILVWKQLVPPAAPNIPDGIPHSWSEFWFLVAEVVSGIILYDATFFWLHWAMHAVPGLRRLHRRHHHTNHPVESRDVLRHSLVDGALQVLVNIGVQRHNWLLQWVLPTRTTKSRLARALHNILVVWMLTESHTSSPYPWIWRKCCVGVREHRHHHLYGVGLNNSDNNSDTSTQYPRYQQFFGYLDDFRLAATTTIWSSS